MNKCIKLAQFTAQRRAFSLSAMSAEPSGDWKVKGLNHVAVACSDLKKVTSLFRDVLKLSVSDPHVLVGQWSKHNFDENRHSKRTPQKEHGVSTVFVQLDNTKIELLEMLGEKSPIAKYLEKNKDGGMHHMCIEVKNIEEAMKDLRAKKIRTLTETTKIGAHGKPVVFLHPKDCGGILIELEEA